MKEQAPHVYVEPPIPTTSEFSTVDQIRNVICQLDAGNFRMPSLLLERQLWNPRFRSVIETRLAGLIATEIRWEPRANNRHARRAAKELTQDWKEIAPGPMRKQMWMPALMLGFGLAQRPMDVAASGRTIFKLRPYWQGFAQWYWARKAYRIQTMEGVTAAGAPSVDRKTADAYAPSVVDRVPNADEAPWVIAEPFGVNSFRNGIIHAAWRSVFGHDLATRDQNRSSEKSGIGAFKAKFPRGKGPEHAQATQLWLRGIRNLNSEGVVPCEVANSDGDGGGFDVLPLEFNGTGGQAISDSLNANAVALAILLLGHNLTTEIKGGGSYAAAGVADYIRDDKKTEDGGGEESYIIPQLIRPWAISNYGDPEIIPVPHYITDSPAVSLQRAQMIYQMSLAAAQLRANVPKVDLEALADEFRLPMLADGVTVPVAGPLPGTTAKPDASTVADPAEEKEAA